MIHKKMTVKPLFAFSFTLLSAALFSVSAIGSLVVTQVGETTTMIGSDSFALRTGNSGSAFFFGNSLFGVNQNTANRVENGTNQYWQLETAIVPGSTAGSSFAYAFGFPGPLDPPAPIEGAMSGFNFSAYDLNQDGNADTIFLLSFGPDILDPNDDVIVAYAMETMLPEIDWVQGRSALSDFIPEPSRALLLIFAALTISMRRTRGGDV